jgi:predicted lipoprotein with Yx(FWY)xxD motif
MAGSAQDERNDMTHTRFTTFSASVAAVLLAVLLVAGCGSSSAAPAAPTTKGGRPATLGVADEDLGKILINSQGHTLYLFQNDTGTTSTCSGACASDWPPLRANGTPTVGSGANASIVGTTARSDGKPQVTYNGHPLYLFVDDQKAGETTGEGLNAFGGNWYAVSPSGNEVTGPPSNPGGGYGY